MYALFYEVDINANVPPKSAHIVSYNLSPKVGDSVAEKYLKNLSFRFRAVLGSKMFQEVSNSINFIQRRQKVWIIMENFLFWCCWLGWNVENFYFICCLYVVSCCNQSIDIIQDSSLPILFHFIAAQVTLQQQQNPNHNNPRNHNFFPTKPFQSSVLIWSKGCFGK